jgi:hypothetical protein
MSSPGPFIIRTTFPKNPFKKNVYNVGRDTKPERNQSIINIAFVVDQAKDGKRPTHCSNQKLPCEVGGVESKDAHMFIG